jgi:flagellar export protein FliJ
MKALPTLLKIAQSRIDTLSVEAARALEEIERLTRSGEAARMRGVEESALGLQSIETAVALPAYQERLRSEQDQRSRRIAEVEETLARVREGLRDAYRERSKFEQLLKRAEERAAAEEAARDQAALDEAAISGARRRGHTTF